MKIINNTDLSYEEIGQVIDIVLDKYQGDTFYVGKTELSKFGLKGKEYWLQIRYLKSYVEWRFDYANN